MWYSPSAAPHAASPTLDSVSRCFLKSVEVLEYEKQSELVAGIGDLQDGV
jgi:hypothetical protein